MMEEVLEEVVEVLRSSYPESVPEEDYLPLLVVLGEGLGEENLGKVVSGFFGVDSHIAIYDYVSAVTIKKPSRSDIDRVREILVANGWSSEDE